MKWKKTKKTPTNPCQSPLLNGPRVPAATMATGMQINYFFPVASWATKFLRTQFYFSVDEKEKSKHSDMNE